MHRRELLRLLVVVGVAGCTGIGDDETLATGPSTGPAGQAPADPISPERVAPPSPSDGARGTPTDPGPATAPTRTRTDAAPSSEPTASPPTEPPPSTERDPAPPSDADPTPDGQESPGADPSTTPTPDATPDNEGDAAPRTVVAVGRDALGLPAPRPGGRAHVVTGLAVHHTASPTAAASTAPGRFRGITRAHRDLGWIDAAYHWGVDVDGNVYELRDERVAGDTRTNYDPAGWFLVVCEGNFEESTPPQAMLDAVADVLAVGAQRYGVDPATIRGHRELAATLCPGANLQDRLPAIREAVAARLAAGGVTLRVEDDTGRVAAIEAG